MILSTKTVFGIGVLSMALSAAATRANAQLPRQPIRCAHTPDGAVAFLRGDQKGECTVIPFDRPNNRIDGNDLPDTQPDDLPRRTLIWAINSPASKDFYTGTILVIPV